MVQHGDPPPPTGPEASAAQVSASAGDAADAEARQVQARYARRARDDERYSLFNVAALMAMQERQRAMLQLLQEVGLTDLAHLRLLEVGSGEGGLLLECLRMGFAPQHLAGIELLPERHALARLRLPAALALRCGDATEALGETGLHHIVMQATVFSSLLDAAYQQRLADAMWAAVKPGGGVMWYDFTVNNPRNPDVRGVPLARVRALFPGGTMRARRLTLAPPLARPLARLHPSLYTLFNQLPLLRTHALAWIAKP